MTKAGMGKALMRAAVLLGMASVSVLGAARAGHAGAGVVVAATTLYRSEAEAMTTVGTTSQIGDSGASGGAALKAWDAASGVSGSASFASSGTYDFTFGGREDYYGGTDGAHAHVALYLDGASTPAGGVYVTNTSGYPAYSIAASVSAGMHSFRLLFDNDAYGGSPSTDRNAYLDYVALSAPASAAATATATATASPVPPTRTPSPVQATATPSGGQAIKTVFLMVMENHNWSDIKGNASAPYINGTLLPMAAHAERYDNPPGNHPSLPNYLWLEAGTNFGITSDNPPSSDHQSTTAHLTSLLNNKGVSWKAYEENISGTSCPLTDSYPYAVRHDPVVYFDDVTNHLSNSSSYCIAHVRPYSELAADLQHNTVARYNLITPNVCDDGHDACAPLNNPVKQTDSWLAAQVPEILNSQAYKNGGALFITWDEGEGGSDGPIGMIVLSPAAKGHGYANTIPYTHSSTLRTLEEIFGVSPLLGDAAHATDLRDLFTTFP